VIEHACQQNTPEWDMLRAGIPTASAFDKIITPTGKLSKQSRDYKAWLLAERVMKAPIPTVKTSFMDRGTEYEAEACDFYSIVSGNKTTRIGFVTNDAGTIGASPDRWSSADGQVEMKVPAIHTHFSYWIAQEAIGKYGADLEDLMKRSVGAALVLVDAKLQERYDEAVANSIAKEYKIQTTGQLWVTERKWADIMSYSPEGLPPVLVRINRDEAFIQTLAQAVSEFSRDLEESAADLVKRGIIQQ